MAKAPLAERIDLVEIFVIMFVMLGSDSLAQRVYHMDDCVLKKAMEVLGAWL